MDSTLDIDKIWDEPIVQKRIDRTNEESDSEQRPSKRPRQALFLADSDDELDTSVTAKQKALPAQDIDIDALFADVEDDIDEEMTFKPLPPALNEEELRRQAEARYRKELPPLTPHQVLPSSSAQHDRTEKPGNTRSHTNKDDQAKDEKKERRRLAKLDENRLLSPDGFPQLIKMTKEFRIKGKGHEATDLHRLLQVYQYWTHQLYPKTQFRDTVERVEKLCHSRRMHVSLSVWRDEAHGHFNGNNAREDDEGREDGDNLNVDSTRMEHNNQDLPPPSSLQASSTDPPRAQANTESRQTRAAEIEGIDFDGDDEAFWRSLDNMAGDTSQNVSTDTSATNSTMDQDQDMWDIVNELEKGGEAPSVVVPMPQPTIPAPPDRPFDPGDDWDDMYL
ncbi:Swi3-domain-containing protein, partial [Phlegmacium glaucopus]